MHKILAIDDKRDNLVTISAVLKNLMPGCQVVTALSGAEGIVKAKEELPDVILLDIKMPRMDGFEVCEKLKANEAVKNIPIILITAVRTDAASRIKGLELGADKFVAKPIDEGELVAQLKVMLRIKKAEDALRKERDELEEIVRERTGKLREERDRAQNYLDVAGVLIIVVGSDQKVDLLNKTGSEILGYSEKELKGKNWFDVAVPADRRDISKTEFRELISGVAGKLYMDYEGTVLTKNDDERIISWHSTVLRNEADKVTAVLSSGKDTTERRQLEEQLNQSQKMEAVGKLAGGIAHDFNNLLTGIIGYSEMLIEDSLHDIINSAYIHEIIKSAQRAASLTQQLLAFSRKQILQPKVLDLNVLLKNTEKMLQRLIEEDIVLISEYDPGLGVIKADPVRIEQIVMNLVVNARDVMPNGGNFLIGTKNVFLDDDFCKKHTYCRPGHYVRLSVQDTGSGMNEDVKKRIFEPFFTTKEVGKGTGLGLSTVYGIVKQSGGYITVDSEVEKGTAFNIYFPRTDECEDDNKTEKVPEEPEGGEETILVVEDEESVRSYIEDVLKSSGYNVLKAGNGDEALEIGRLQSTIDLIITDVVMPGKSGPELIEMMQDFHPGTRVLFMSGYHEDFFMRRGAFDKEIHFFHKPFTPGSLKQKVRELLDGR